MGIEIFVLAVCVRGSADGCEYASSAYYAQSGLQRSLESKSQEYQQRYPILSPVVATAGIIYTQRVTVGAGDTKSFTYDAKQNMLSFKKEF